MKYRACFLVVLALFAFACNMPSQKPPQTATATLTAALPSPSPENTEVQATAAPTVQTEATEQPLPASPTFTGSPTAEPPTHGTLLYETRFTQGWVPLTGDKATGTPTSEGYQIDISQPWALYAYTSRSRQTTFFAEITAKPLQCQKGNGGYGMVFAYQSDTSFRIFMIWCSGRYSLLERVSTSSVNLLGEGTLPAGIDPVSGEHTLGVGALNNRLVLYVDSQQVAKVDVSTLPAGDFGPYAETTGSPLSVLFTWLSIYMAG
jgi:hypothetical protein